jgi:predicted kinase
MAKLSLNQPTLILLYGFPGSGKTFIGRQLCEDISAAHLQGDRIRAELFDDPRYDQQENEVVSHLMEYMTEEFLKSGVSVVYDMNAARANQRRILRDLARSAKAKSVLIWLQVDPESAFARGSKRDHRKADDKYSKALDEGTFRNIAGQMQNPAGTEDYIVISGKHTYKTQRSAIVKKFYDLGLISRDTASAQVVKPGMVNLVPNPIAGRVDQSRRNVIIR